MKKTIYILALIAIVIRAQAQSVGINATGVAPHSSSVLDLNTGNTFSSPNGKGLLPPNVPLTGITDAVTITSPATSLLVYNTATANTGTLAVVPGYYYWNGTQWVALGGSDWHTLGNIGTTAGTNFLGTTDAQDMVFKTNNIENMRITNSNGNVGIGTATPNAALDVSSTSSTTSAHIASFERLGVTGSIWMHSGASGGDWNGNVSAGDKSIIFTNDNDPLINSNSGLVIAPWTSVGNPNQSAGLKIMENGNVGIGTTSPATKLDIENGNINGAIKIVDGTQSAGKVLKCDANGVGTWQTIAPAANYGNVSIPDITWVTDGAFHYTGYNVTVPPGRSTVTGGFNVDCPTMNYFTVQMSISPSTLTLAGGVSCAPGLSGFSANGAYNTAVGSSIFYVNNTSGSNLTIYLWGVPAGAINGNTCNVHGTFMYGEPYIIAAY